jgi:recombinational DNA repair protein (RecF pathway)
LRALAGEEPAAPCLPAFQSDLLRAIGYAPNLEECVSCRRTVGGGRPVFFSGGAGGLLCRDCEGHYTEKWRVSPRIVGTTPRTGDPRDWFELLDYHLTYIAGRRFKTATELAGLLGRPPFGS